MFSKGTWCFSFFLLEITFFVALNKWFIFHVTCWNNIRPDKAFPEAINRELSTHRTQHSQGILIIIWFYFPYMICKSKFIMDTISVYNSLREIAKNCISLISLLLSLSWWLVNALKTSISSQSSLSINIKQAAHAIRGFHFLDRGLGINKDFLLRRALKQMGIDAGWLNPLKGLYHTK